MGFRRMFQEALRPRPSGRLADFGQRRVQRGQGSGRQFRGRPLRREPLSLPLPKAVGAADHGIEEGCRPPSSIGLAETCPSSRSCLPSNIGLNARQLDIFFPPL